MLLAVALLVVGPTIASPRGTVADEGWGRLPSASEIAAATQRAEQATPGYNRVSTRVTRLHDPTISDPANSSKVLLTVTDAREPTWRFSAAWLAQQPDGSFDWQTFMEGDGPRGWWQADLIGRTGSLAPGWLGELPVGPALPRPGPISNIAGVCASGGRVPGIVPTFNLGTPNAEGANLQERLDPVTDQIAVTFRVTEPRAAFVYVGDQWYDLDLALFSITKDVGLACWQTTGARARSDRHQGRAIQLLRPDEQIVERLEPGDYALLVGLAPDARYDPSHTFTIRVALAPPLCGTLSPPNVPNPRYPGLLTRADDAWYQLGITVEPPEGQRGPHALLSFNAFVSPPYSDLFDFEWEIDGQPVRDQSGPTILEPASHLPRPGHDHTVRVTARGVRPYPDPDQPHVPPTLSATCTFGAP